MATQAETQRGLNLAKTRDWLAIAAAVAVVVGAMGAGIQWAVSSAVAPLAVRLERIESQLDSHSGILVELRERLTRVETILLERARERAPAE